MIGKVLKQRTWNVTEIRYACWQQFKEKDGKILDTFLYIYFDNHFSCSRSHSRPCMNLINSYHLRVVRGDNISKKAQPYNVRQSVYATNYNELMKIHHYVNRAFFPSSVCLTFSAATQIINSHRMICG